MEAAEHAAVEMQEVRAPIRATLSKAIKRANTLYRTAIESIEHSVFAVEYRLLPTTKCFALLALELLYAQSSQEQTLRAPPQRCKISALIC